MLQNSLFSSSMADAVESVAIPEAQTTAKTNRRRKTHPSTGEVSNPQSSQPSSRKAQIIADAQTPILDRYALHEVVPLTEFLEVCQEVDRRLAELLEKSTTVAEVVCAFATEPYACPGEAVRLVGETALIEKLLRDLRTDSQNQAVVHLVNLPRFLQQKIWTQLLPQEQSSLIRAAQGGQA